jgi:predicted RNase H-like HicB family nuclease
MGTSDIMTVEDYKAVLYRQEDGLWVAEIPAMSGCYALMETCDLALTELGKVFAIIAAEYRDKGLTLPADSTEILHV